MTCFSHTTNKHYHTAPPHIVQSIAQSAHNTQHITRWSLTELRNTSLQSDTNSSRGRC